VNLSRSASSVSMGIRWLSAVSHGLMFEKTAPRDSECKPPNGAFVAYQVDAMRPIPEMGRYRSPVANVYLCGSGSHPGPGVTLAPGRNAAQAIYRDLGLNF